MRRLVFIIIGVFALFSMIRAYAAAKQPHQEAVTYSESAAVPVEQ